MSEKNIVTASKASGMMNSPRFNFSATNLKWERYINSHTLIYYMAPSLILNFISIVHLHLFSLNTKYQDNTPISYIFLFHILAQEICFYNHNHGFGGFFCLFCCFFFCFFFGGGYRLVIRDTVITWIVTILGHFNHFIILIFFRWKVFIFRKYTEMFENIFNDYMRMNIHRRVHFNQNENK